MHNNMLQIWFVGFQYIIAFICVMGQECPYDSIAKGCNDSYPVKESIGFDVDIIDNTLYPYIVSLQKKFESQECYQHFCGGTMIASNLVLTAAHCMEDIKENQLLRYSQDKLIYRPRSSDYFVAISPKCRHLKNEKYERMAIEEIYIHPDFNNNFGALHNDVAIVKLVVKKENFFEGPLVQLADQNVQISKIQEPLVTMGYGQRKGQPYFNNTSYTVFPLHGAQLNYLDYDICKAMIIDRQDNISANELDYDSMVCCFNPQAGICDGDSGGPLLDGDMQIGIVSWGLNGSCQVENTQQAPSVFVRLSKYVDWIQNIIATYGCHHFELCQKSEDLLMSPPPVILEDPCNQAEDLRCDVEALQSFKSSVTEGKSELSTWIGDNPCRWKYVTCTKVDGVKQRVVKLELGKMDLDLEAISSLLELFQSNSRTISGVMVPEFSKLRYMREFQIRSLNINGSLPKEYSLLDRLEVFYLSQLELTNTIPAEYSLWTQLKNFTILFSDLTGVIPKEFSTWKQLQIFGVGENKFSGSIAPEYSEWTDLTSFVITNNQFQSTIPAELSNWKNCKFISLDQNMLSGTLPSEFSELSQVIIMGYTVNKLTGTIPQEYSELINLQMFLMGQNSIWGGIPAQFSTWKKVGMLQMYENALTGSIPVELSEMSSLQELSLSSNKLTGTLPVQFSNWNLIYSIKFRVNYISGTLPGQYSSFDVMTDFQMQQNKLTGTLPVQYSTWSSCVDFGVYQNQLQGTLPPQYSEMIRINKFLVWENNLLSGNIPKEYSTMKNMQHWDSYGTQINQDIPEEFSVFSPEAKISV